jgi:cysteine desulfurase
MVSIIAANNESGVVQPIHEIALLVRQWGAYLHFDATQALGRIPVDVMDWDADLVTLSSHKVGGPHGAGALWVRHGTPLTPLVHGGHQERNRRGGTEATAILVGFGSACQLAHRNVADEAVRLAALRDALWSGIKSMTPQAVRHGSTLNCLPNTLNVSLCGHDGATILMALDIAGISVSSGSACTAGSLDPSHVLLSMGVAEDVARSAVRFSLGYDTTGAEIERVLATLSQVVEQSSEEEN